MNLAYSRLKKRLAKLNLKSFTFDDVLRICKNESIHLRTMNLPDKIRGYYTSELKKKYRKKYIVLNEKLSSFESLFVALHELVHHYLHISMQRKQTFYCRIDELNDSKQDQEAEMMALIMLIPKGHLLEYAQMPAEELHPYLQKLLVKRQHIFEKFGV